MPSHPTVSIVVPTYNHGRLLRGALDSVAGQRVPTGTIELIVVDDGSTDDTSLVVDRWRSEHPACRLHYARQPNLGVNAARNRGISLSTGDILAFLDADERMPADHVEKILGAFALEPQLAGVGGPAIGVPSHHRRCRDCRIGDATVTEVNDEGHSRRLLGGNMAIRREVFLEVGAFDESLSGRGDEVEWFHRANRFFRYEPSLVIDHARGDATLRELIARSYRQGRSIPKALAKTGQTWSPLTGRLPRVLVHGVTRRCTNGILLAAREAGAILGWVSDTRDARRNKNS